MAKPGRKPKQPGDSNGSLPFPAAAGVVRRGRPPKGDGASVSSYFRQVYKERPDLLWERSNNETLLRWLKDHPGHRQVPERVTKILANLKSVLRKQAGKKRGRKAAAQPAVVTPMPVSTSIPRKGLQALEEHIDESLALAKSIDRARLEGVISSLRQARNEVVWKIGH